MNRFYDMDVFQTFQYLIGISLLGFLVAVVYLAATKRWKWALFCFLPFGLFITVVASDPCDQLHEEGYIHVGAVGTKDGTLHYMTGKAWNQVPISTEQADLVNRGAPVEVFEQVYVNRFLRPIRKQTVILTKELSIVEDSSTTVRAQENKEGNRLGTN